MNSSATEASTTNRLGDAALPRVEEPAPGGHGRDARQVGVGQDDEGVRATQLEYGLLDRVPGCCAHGSSGSLAAGDRDGADAGVLDQPPGDRRDVRLGDQQRGEQPLRCAGTGQDALHGQGAAGGVRGVLEQCRVAGHERRSREPQHLPQREVPRHDGEHHADRLVADPAAVGRGGHRLVGEEVGRVLGVVVARGRALLHLGAGLGQGLAHLAGDQQGELLDLGAQHLGRPAEDGGPLGERPCGPPGLRVGRAVESRVDVGVREGGVLGQPLPRRRVDRDDGAHAGVALSPWRAGPAPRSLSDRCSNVSPVAVIVRVTSRPP